LACPPKARTCGARPFFIIVPLWVSNGGLVLALFWGLRAELALRGQAKQQIQETKEKASSSSKAFPFVDFLNCSRCFFWRF